MYAEVFSLNNGGAIATIIATVILLGGILLTQVRKARGRGMSRQAIDEVVIGVPEVRAANGRVIQAERPGLIDRMDDMDKWRGTVDDRLDKILDKVTPNGGHTKSPADTALRTEDHIKKLAERLDVELDE